jgi:hypothetical protein
VLYSFPPRRFRPSAAFSDCRIDCVILNHIRWRATALLVFRHGVISFIFGIIVGVSCCLFVFARHHAQRPEEGPLASLTLRPDRTLLCSVRQTNRIWRIPTFSVSLGNTWSGCCYCIPVNPTSKPTMAKELSVPRIRLDHRICSIHPAIHKS